MALFHWVEYAYPTYPTLSLLQCR